MRLNSAGVRSVAVAFLASAVVSCSSQPEREPSLPHVLQAPPEIGASFDVENPSASSTRTEVSAEHTLIRIQRSSLNKAFLLMPAMILVGNEPGVSHLLPKIVLFRENGEQLGMFEVNPYAVYDGIGNEKLLQAFSIVRSDADSISFRMELGLSAIPLKDTLGVSDEPSTLEAMASSEDQVLPVVSSFVKRARFEGNELEIAQVSRVRVSKSTLDLMKLLELQVELSQQTRDFTVELITRIVPYQPNPRFEPRPSTRQRGVGYFEVAKRRKNHGGLDVLATRWDTSPEAGPIVYKITRNVPSELVESVKEGVLYWNAVFGREVLRVETGAELDAIARRREAIIRWIPWDGAGFAMAGFQPDPLTGEILSADVFMTSMWALMSGQDIRKALGGEVKAAKAVLGPSGFESSNGCNLSTRELLNGMLSLASAASASGEMGQTLLLKATRDMIRHVVAHEVGHTLGLRHNFAGNMQAELKNAHEHIAVWKEYLADPDHRGAVVASTVMDYTANQENFLLGAAIQEKVLAYDKAAIDWGYGADPIDPETLSSTLAFCTDMEANSKLLGCRPFDLGVNPVDGFALSLGLNRETLATFIVDNLVDAIRPVYPQDRSSVYRRAVLLDPEKISARSTREASAIFDLIGKDAEALAVKRALEGNNWLSKDAFAMFTPLALSQALEGAGGLPGILKAALGQDQSLPLNAPAPGWLVSEILVKTERGRLAQGTTFFGVDYSLGPQEAAQVRGYALRIGAELESAYLRDLVLALTGVNPQAAREASLLTAILSLLSESPGLAPGLAKDEWAKELGPFAAQLILLPGDEPILGARNGEAFEVPSTRYPVGVRLAAVRLFSDPVFSKPGWMNAEQAALAEVLKKRILTVIKPKKSLLKRIFSLGSKELQLSDNLVQWLREELAVLAALSEADKPSAGLLETLLGASLAGASFESAGVSDQRLLEAVF